MTVSGTSSIAAGSGGGSPTTIAAEAAHPVARHLGHGAVGVEQLHRRARRGAPIEDETVGSDATVPVAHGPREVRSSVSLNEALLDKQEVVPVGVGLNELDRHGCTPLR